MFGNPYRLAGRLYPIYQVLMQWRSKPGNAAVEAQVGGLGNTIMFRLRNAGFTQLSYAISFFSSEWDGWRLFEGTDIEGFHQTIQQLRRAPYPDYGYNNIGGVELDKWLETQFTIGRGVYPQMYIHEPIQIIQMGEVVRLAVQLADPEAMQERPSNVTFNAIDPSMVELVASSERGSKRETELVVVDFDEEGKAEVGVKALQEGEVSVFIHLGDPPEGGNYEENPKRGLLYTATAEA